MHSHFTLPQAISLLALYIQDLINLFISQPDLMKVLYGLTIWILLTIYLLRGLNKFSLEYTQGERYYGDAECSSVLRGTEACSIVARDNSCLYLWQANRLIKGSHVCFCARYLALSKHHHISTPQPSQTQHFLPYCGGRPWHVEPALRFFFCPVSSGRAANGSQRMRA